MDNDQSLNLHRNVSGMSKYCFKVRSRAGPVVDKITISSRSEPEALARLMRLYPGCTILEQQNKSLDAPEDSFVHAVDLIADEDALTNSLPFNCFKKPPS